jgi:putative N6-adenine-specific DNA methylase
MSRNRALRLPLFAVAAPGLEPLVAAELAALGITATAERGGAAWDGTLAELYTANLQLRTASRILARVGHFRARTFPELERYAGRLPWADFIAPGRAVQLRVSCHKSRLYHEKAVAERVRGAIERVVGPLEATAGGNVAGGRAAVPGTRDEEDDDGEAAQLVVVRFHYDRCTISVDSSGALLHRRGYRQELARAPLRETLAAALIMASGWPGDAPLVDPFCGSGTIPIESALIARRIAPGLAHPPGEPRSYAFQEWPDYDAPLWYDLVARARAEIRPAAGTPILGSDRDTGAINAAAANAERAGVLADLDLAVRPLSALEPPPGAGWLVTNPPYGVRVGERAPLRDLYATLGKVARERLPGWHLTLLSADRALERQVRIPLESVLETRNGGIAVRVIRGEVGVVGEG